MEIERKYLVAELPKDLEKYEQKKIAQGYLNTDPVVRVRRSNDEYYMTYKGKGLLAREEYNLPLNESAYEHLLSKIDGRLIEKVRYLIPLEGKHVAELDVFFGALEGLRMVEVEFDSIEESQGFVPPAWFGKEVTLDKRYHNSNLAMGGKWNE